MKAGIEDRGIFLKSVLGTVTVVHIPVKNHDFIKTMFGLQVTCSDSNVVEQAKPERSIFLGMVAGRPNQGKAVVRFALYDLVYQSKNSTHCKPRDIKGLLADGDIGAVQIRLPLFARLPRAFKKLSGVYSPKPLGFAESGRHRPQSFKPVLLAQLGECVGQPSRSFRVTRPRVVLGKSFVTQKGSCHSGRFPRLNSIRITAHYHRSRLDPATSHDARVSRVLSDQQSPEQALPAPQAKQISLSAEGSAERIPGSKVTGLEIIAATAGVVAAYLLLFRYWPFRANCGKGIQGNKPQAGCRADSFTVGTYNIHRSRGLDGKRDLHRIADVIEGCDMIGLQEVEGSTLRGFRNQGDLLAERLGLGVHFSPTRRRCLLPNRGNAFLTRLPIEHWSSEPLTPSRSKRYRNLTLYAVRVNGELVHVINTHLSEPTVVLEPLQRVLELFRQFDRAILLGDFNTMPDHPSLVRLTQTHALDATALSSEQSDRIDWILVRGLRIDSAWSVPKGPSDHPFYAARLSLS